MFCSNGCEATRGKQAARCNSVEKGKTDDRVDEPSTHRRKLDSSVVEYDSDEEEEEDEEDDDILVLLKDKRKNVDKLELARKTFGIGNILSNIVSNLSINEIVLLRGVNLLLNDELAFGFECNNFKIFFKYKNKFVIDIINNQCCDSLENFTLFYLQSFNMKKSTFALKRKNSEEIDNSNNNDSGDNRNDNNNSENTTVSSENECEKKSFLRL